MKRISLLLIAAALAVAGSLFLVSAGAPGRRSQAAQGTPAATNLVGGDEIVARIDSRVKVSRGESIRLAIDPHLVHLFDPRTGQAVL